MIDYKELAERLRPYWESILLDNSPGGKIVGREYTAGDISGQPGKSFKFNLDTGKWSDFAVGDKGGDIISYYGKVKGISNSEAKKELYEHYLSGKPVKHSYPITMKTQSPKIIKPPPNVNEPSDILKDGVAPTKKYAYRDIDGQPLYYVFRYEYPDGSKDFWPMSFYDNGKWSPGLTKGLRSLYNLDKLVANPTKPVMVVEGEKTASAAEQLAGNAYTVTTWPGGHNGLGNADISPLKGRKLLLWPDADPPGIKCMDTLAAKLLLETEEIKVIRPDVNSGWDAADALAEGWDWAKFKDWAKRPGILEPLAKPIKHVNAELLDAEGDNHSQQLVGEISPVPSIMAKQLGLKTKEIRKEVCIVPNSSNVNILLSKHTKFKDHFWFDDFYKRGITTFFGKQQFITDDMVKQITLLLQKEYGLEMLALSNVETAVVVTCLENVKNEPKDWMNELKWDQTKRVEEFFINALGSADNEYVRKVSQNFFVAQVARIMRPGCKFDNMVILEGLQGTGKSSMLKALIGEKWFAEPQAALDNKDFEGSLLGKLIIEFAELDHFRKAENTLIKKKLSCSIDAFRLPYGKRVEDVPRTCIFVGTTNKDDYLHDETGGRRFWPIKTSTIDMQYIQDNREQLYAEAVQMYREGFEYFSVPESAKEEQEARRAVHPWEDIFITYFSTAPGINDHHMTTNDLWSKVLSGEILRITRNDILAIGKIMRSMGWEYKPIRVGGAQPKKEWVRPGYTWLDDHSKQAELPIQPPRIIPNYAKQQRSDI